MVDPFEERARLRQSSISSGDIFEQRAALRKQQTPTQQPQEPVTLKGAASAYGTGYAGGAGGFVPDILNLIKQTGLGGIAGNFLPDLKGTRELTHDIQSETGAKPPKNALERILQQGGEFGGMEALLGTATGGPVGGALGTAHGTASGLMYGSLKELGIPDTWALLGSALFTLSPIAARRLIPKMQEMLKSGKSVEEAAEILEKDLANEKVPQAVAKPPPVPGQESFLPKEIPTGRTSYELAEEALPELQRPEIEAEKTSAISLPKIEAEAKPLTGRVKVLNDEVENIVSPDKFYNDTQAGRKLSADVKHEFNEQNKTVRKLYKNASKVYKTEYDIVPELADKVETLIEDLTKTAEPSTAETAVLKKLQGLQKIIGTKLEPIEVGMERLIKSADSISQTLNYEIPTGGVKNLLKGLVKDINESVISSLERKGVNTAPMKKADKFYAQMAEKFFNPEIEPFLEKTIRDPEGLYQNAVKDRGKYRALTEAIYKKNPKAIQKYERDVVGQIIRPYVEDMGKIESKEFNKTMDNLEGLIGYNTTEKVRRKLLKQKKIQPPKLKISKEHKPKEFPKHRVTSATIEKASKYLDKKPSDIEKMFNSREGIKELKKDLKEKGLSKLFDKMIQEKTVDILRGGRIGKRKLTGSNIHDEITKTHNYELLKEFYGEESVNKMIDAAEKGARKEATKDMFKELIKLGATVSGASKLYKAISIVIKGV